MGSIAPYFLPALGFAFLVLLAKSESLFYIFGFLFWGTIIIGIGTVIVVVHSARIIAFSTGSGFA